MAQGIQSYQSHARYFPLFHYFAVPVLALNFLNSIRHVYLAPNLSTAFQMVVAAALLGLALAARVMAITVQDRVIRLEMQLRLARILPPELQAKAAGIRKDQFVALRFASDQELPDLVREVCEGRLNTSKEIKMRVKNWQADWLRA